MHLHECDNPKCALFHLCSRYWMLFSCLLHVITLLFHLKNIQKKSLLWKQETNMFYLNFLKKTKKKIFISLACVHRTWNESIIYLFVIIYNICIPLSLYFDNLIYIWLCYHENNNWFCECFSFIYVQFSNYLMPSLHTNWYASKIITSKKIVYSGNLIGN